MKQMDIVKLLKKEAVESQQEVELLLINAKYSRPVYGYEHELGLSLKQVLNRLKMRQEHPIVVLDVMCGGGSTVKELNGNYSVNAFGVDKLYYPDFQDLEYKDRFIVTSAEDLSMIPDGSVDLILNLNGYAEFFSSIYKPMREALRVLCPGGELHSAPFLEREKLTDTYCREGYEAIDDYERETGQKLKYKATRRLSWHRFPPIRMSPVLHLEK